MNIKKIIFSLLLVLGVVSCTSESSVDILENTEVQKAMNYPVEFNLNDGRGGGTRATQESTTTLAALDNEKAINNLVIVVFNDMNVLEKVIKHSDITFSNSANLYEGGVFDVGLEGTFQLEFIANSSVSFQSSLQPGMTFAQYSALKVSGLPTHGESGFVMTNVDPVSVTTQKQQTTDLSAPVLLRRLAARFDVFSNVDGLHIESITLKNQVSESFVVTDASIPTGSDAAKVFNQSSNPAWFTATKAVAGIYSYENPVAGATTLLVKGRYTHSTSNPAWEKEVVFLDGTGNPLPIKRNHLYRVRLAKDPEGQIDPVSGDITFNIEVLDWNQATLFEYSDNEFLNTKKEKFTEYVFSATPAAFGNAGGSGTISGVKKTYAGTDNTAPLLSTEPVNNADFAITSKLSNPAGITVNDADKSFTVSTGTTAADYVIVATINGAEHEVTVRRAANNPLSYVAKYNVNQAGNAFVTSETACNVSGYFSYDQAVAQFSSKEIDGVTYHLPSIEEWRGIVPPNTYVYFNSSGNAYNNVSETVTVNGTSYTSTNDYRNVGNKTYALRYKGTDLVSAWKYEFINNGINTHMKITSRSVYGQNVTIADIANETFWTQAPNVERCFPASGYNSNGSTGSLRYVGAYGYFWSSSPGSSSYAWSMGFGSGYAHSSYNRNRYFGFSVRLFSPGN